MSATITNNRHLELFGGAQDKPVRGLESQLDPYRRNSKLTRSYAIRY